jgi:hypothetical protein
MLRRPRAPPPRSKPACAIASSALRVNPSSEPYRRKSVLYCLIRALRGSVRMRIRSSTAKGWSDDSTGRRPKNSGISPKSLRSVVVGLSVPVATGTERGAPKPMD